MKWETKHRTPKAKADQLAERQAQEKQTQEMLSVVRLTAPNFSYSFGFTLMEQK